MISRAKRVASHSDFASFSCANKAANFFSLPCRVCISPLTRAAVRLCIHALHAAIHSSLSISELATMISSLIFGVPQCEINRKANFFPHSACEISFATVDLSNFTAPFTVPSAVAYSSLDAVSEKALSINIYNKVVTNIRKQVLLYNVQSISIP